MKGSLLPASKVVRTQRLFRGVLKGGTLNSNSVLFVMLSNVLNNSFT